MKNIGYIIIGSFVLTLVSFRRDSSPNYWRALKGITKITYKYKDKEPLVGIISKDPWNVLESINDSCKGEMPLKKTSLSKISNESPIERSEKKRSCKFPISAKRLNGKRIHLLGLITRLPSKAYILTEEEYNPNNPLEWPKMDERIELDGDFSERIHTKVVLEGKLRLNKHDCSRAFYILEKISLIE